MPIYTAYFIFLGLSALSLFIALIAKAFAKNRTRTRDTTVWIVISIVVVYYLVRFIFGWRMSNWYAEAFLVLGVCILLDYFILFKYRYSQQLRIVYYTLRMTGILIPPILFAMPFVVVLVSLGFSKGVACYVVPVDTSYGEQWVYKNLYIYQKDCELQGELAFKKKFLFFEKELTTINVSKSLRSSNEEHITGFISKKDNIIYISNVKYTNGPPEKNYQFIKITILEPDYLKIERVLYMNYLKNDENREDMESSQIQFVKL